ncbi:ribonuclease HII [bacterium]|nr:MAG: ribonuclease HII [bacterium]
MPRVAAPSKLAAYDEALRLSRGASSLAGVDEVGRGPLAGPVVAAAVILPPDPAGLSGVRDSKTLSPARRDALYRLIRARAVAVGVGSASPAEITERNILQATFLAMRRALEDLGARADYLVVDGDKKLPGWEGPQEALVRGDGTSLCVAAASVVAKVVRDRWMGRLDFRHPGYGFSKHKGYGTAEHYAALDRLGPSPVHRPTFL